MKARTLYVKQQHALKKKNTLTEGKKILIKKKMGTDNL